jgi:hypothetical protein
MLARLAARGNEFHRRPFGASMGKALTEIATSMRAREVGT